MKHYLITGGAGFIGSNLIGSLVNKNRDVAITCIDNFDPFYSREIKQFNIREFKDDFLFRLVEMDLGRTTGEELAQLIPRKVDVIIHLAAKAGVRQSIDNPIPYQQANVAGLQNMLDFARIKGVRQFVFASSSSVYGNNNHYPWNENEELKPISPYAVTKMKGEMLGHIHHKLYGVRFIALRLFTVYGPGQRPDLAIHKFTGNILGGKPIPVFGDGNTSRDYTYVDDTVKAIMAAALYDRTGFEVFNIGNHYSVSLQGLIERIEKVTGRKAIIDRQAEQPGDVQKTFADIEKARRLLGYDPKTNLEDGLKKFYRWYLEMSRKTDPVTGGNRQTLLPIP